MSTLRLLIASWLLLSIGSALAQQTCAANGCGSGWSRWFVPNQSFGTSFLSACTAHDYCYGGCPIPKERTELYACRTASKQILNPRGCCDDSFLQDLVNICRSQAPSKKLCRLAGVVYYLAVDAFGDSAFEGKGLKEWLRDDASTDDSLPTLLFEQTAYVAAAIGRQEQFDQRAVIVLNADGSIRVRLEQRTLIASIGGPVPLLSERNRRLRGNAELVFGDMFELSGVSPEVERKLRERLGPDALRLVPKK